MGFLLAQYASFLFLVLCLNRSLKTIFICHRIYDRVYLALRQSFPYPSWIPAAIKDGEDHNRIIDDAIIYGKREAIGELAVVSEDYLMNTCEVCQRIDVRIKGIEEIRSEAGRLRLIEAISLFNILLDCA